MGAAIRRASQVLGGQPQKRRLLLLLSDGKPNDLDRYEGPLRHRGHPPGGDRGAQPGTGALLHHHRQGGGGLPALPVRRRRLRGRARRAVPERLLQLYRRLRR